MGCITPCAYYLDSCHHLSSPNQVPGADSPVVHTESEFRYEATGERYVPSEEGLTLASCINNPRQFLSKAADLLDLEPMDEEWAEEVVPLDEDEQVRIEDVENGIETHGESQGRVYLDSTEDISFMWSL